VRGLGANVLKGRVISRAAKAAAEAVLPEFKSKAA
jgi:hypothetical protein